MLPAGVFSRQILLLAAYAERYVFGLYPAFGHFVALVDVALLLILDDRERTAVLRAEDAWVGEKLVFVRGECESLGGGCEQEK